MGNETPNKNINLEGGLRSENEKLEAHYNKDCFINNKDSWETKLENFPKYVRRQNLTRFLALYELFKLVLDVKGSIIECGVHRGFGLMSWTKLSAILEPVNLTRRIYGFDTFEGFTSLKDIDLSTEIANIENGSLKAGSLNELETLIAVHDSTRFLGHVKKTHLIQGDAVSTIPDFMNSNRHILISLLFLDFDLYAPTLTALKHFVPRMPKGAILAFDELDNPLWPGETSALIDYFGEDMPRLKRLEFDPYISYYIIE